MQETTLGGRVKLLRNKRGITQIQLATELYISESYIALIEADKRNPSMEIVSKLADFFCVTSDYLINGKPMDSEEMKLKEWSELIKGRSDKEVRHALELVRSFFDCIDNDK
ncbi:MAG: helix-turn-helix domain-containing protein [Oscillospiraceae bacterium]